jgi:hypothetical protein
MTNRTDEDEERDDLARALRAALARRKKPRGLAADIAAHLAGRRPIDAPESTGEPVIALNDDDALKARALGGLTATEGENQW